jgi:hypothetical protein
VSLVPQGIRCPCRAAAGALDGRRAGAWTANALLVGCPLLNVSDVGAYVLTVRFQKTNTNQCQVTAWARDRKPFPVSHMAGASRLPHDLATFVIERDLSIAGGFFNLVAHGAVFRSSGRRITRSGRDLIIANRAALEDAERTVHQVQSLWGRHQTSPAGLALTDADERWRALDPGHSLELAWFRLPLPARPAARSGRARHMRRG